MKLRKILFLMLLPVAFAACGKLNADDTNLTTNSNNSAPKAATPTAVPIHVSEVQKVNFSSETYQTSSCKEVIGLADTVTLKLGKFEDPAERFYHIVDNKQIYGDLDGDGREEAVVPIFCGGRQSKLTSFEIQVFTAENKKPRLLARIDATTMEADYKKSDPKGFLVTLGGARPEIKDGLLIVKAPTDGEKDSPKNLTTFTYKLTDGKLVLQGKPSKMRIGN